RRERGRAVAGRGVLRCRPSRCPADRGSRPHRPGLTWIRSVTAVSRQPNAHRVFTFSFRPTRLTLLRFRRRTDSEENVVARRVLPLFVTHDGISSRSNITCKYKCGDACSHAVPNTSRGEYFGDIVRAAVSRRGVLRGGAMAVLAVGAGCLLTGGADDSAAAAGSDAGAAGDLGPVPDGTNFTAVAPNTDDAVTVPEGYENDVVIRWGDPVLPDAPAFDIGNQTATAQEKQFGF